VKMQDGVVSGARRKISAHCEPGKDQKREQCARPTPRQALAARSRWEASRRHALSSTRAPYRCKNLKIVQGLEMVSSSSAGWSCAAQSWGKSVKE
jgi:hypothetical protein